MSRLLVAGCVLCLFRSEDVFHNGWIFLEKMVYNVKKLETNQTVSTS